MANNEHGVNSKDYLRRVAEGSGNVDPSGNFSIEVLRSALATRFDVSLESISSKPMEKIEITTLSGFICNKESHWFAIRKINDRYWNLNSTFDHPKFISSFHLAKEIEGLRNSGYSVFTIENDKSLPRICSSDGDRHRGQAKFWWKEVDLVKGKTNPMNQGNNPWNKVGSGMRLDGKSTNTRYSSGGMDTNLSEEEMLQMALSASLQKPNAEPAVDLKLEEEPPTTDPNAVRIQFRLPQGKKVVRRFLKSDLVASVYAFIEISCQGEGHGRVLQLKSGFPPKSLENKKTNTILEANLSGELVQGRFV